MAMVVKNNLSAKNTLNVLDKNDKALAKSLKQASSGLRINSAADDASGYAISERMDVQMRGLDKDYDNTQTGNSMLKTAEGAVQSTVDVLRTMKEKAVDAANDTNTDDDRATIQKQLDQLINQIDENANTTYNGKTMIDGSMNNEVVEPGTSTVFANMSLSQDTTGRTRLTRLQDFSGRSLTIKTDSSLEVSIVKKGVTTNYTLNPVGNYTLATLFSAGTDLKDANGNVPAETATMNSDTYVGVGRNGEDVYTSNGLKAFTITAADPGIDGQIDGITFNVMERDGTINRTANSVLNNMTEVIRAQDPSPDNAAVFQIGTKANQSVKVGFTDMRSVALGLTATDGSTLNISTQKNANAAIAVIDNALHKATDQITDIGAVRNRLDYTGSNVQTASENTQSSMSTIRDADMAKTMTEYTKNNVLSQSAQAMLAQANQNSSAVLSLLQ